MAWQNLKYSTIGAIIGGIIGLVGSILRPFFWSMNSDPLFIFGFPGSILKLAGVGGCSWKSSSCPVAEFYGYIVTIIIFSLIGSLIGFIVGKIRLKK